MGLNLWVRLNRLMLFEKTDYVGLFGIRDESSVVFRFFLKRVSFVRELKRIEVLFLLSEFFIFLFK